MNYLAFFVVETIFPMNPYESPQTVQEQQGQGNSTWSKRLRWSLTVTAISALAFLGVLAYGYLTGDSDRPKFDPLLLLSLLTTAGGIVISLVVATVSLCALLMSRFAT